MDSNINNAFVISQKYRISYKRGIIKFVSPQGDKLYAAVKELPRYEIVNGEQVFVPGTYIGNISNVDEKDLTLAEVLIETDIDLSMISYSPSSLIGKEVMVMMNGPYPFKVLVGKSGSSSRRISQKDMLLARKYANGESLDSERAISYLKELGYSEDEINNTISETIGSTGIEGKVAEYGSAPSWHTFGPTQQDNAQDLSESADKGIVEELPSGQIENKICYKPAKALTGR